MRQNRKRDRHNETASSVAQERTYRKTFERTLHQVDLALLALKND